MVVASFALLDLLGSQRRLGSLQKSIYLVKISQWNPSSPKYRSQGVAKKLPNPAVDSFERVKKKTENKSSIRKRREGKREETSRSVKQIALSITLTIQYLEMREQSDPGGRLEGTRIMDLMSSSSAPRSHNLLFYDGFCFHDSGRVRRGTGS